MAETRCKKVGYAKFLTEEQLREHLQYFCGRKVHVFLLENGLSFGVNGTLYYGTNGKYSVEIPAQVTKAVNFTPETVVEVNGAEIRLRFPPLETLGE